MVTQLTTQSVLWLELTPVYEHSLLQFRLPRETTSSLAFNVNNITRCRTVNIAILILRYENDTGTADFHQSTIFAKARADVSQRLRNGIDFCRNCHLEGRPTKKLLQCSRENVYREAGTCEPSKSRQIILQTVTILDCNAVES